MKLDKLILLFLLFIKVSFIEKRNQYSSNNNLENQKIKFTNHLNNNIIDKIISFEIPMGC